MLPATDVAEVSTDLDLVAIADLLQKRGRVRGEPVAITLFRDEIPDSYGGRRVEPCAIVHHAMNLGERVYVDREHQDCLAGAWQAGFLDPPEEIKSGRYLSDAIPGFSAIAAARVKTGINTLPQGLVRGIGAAPLRDVPEGTRVDSVVCVVEPVHAAQLAGVRTVVDGTPPRGSAGTSLCGELFAIPWHDDNVIMTPGDMGGRMFTKVAPSEMFVIIPFRWLGHLPALYSSTPDVSAMMEAIKPGHQERHDAWLAERAARRRAERGEGGEGGAAAAADDELQWDEECRELLAKAPDEIRIFAEGTLATYAAEHDHSRITMAVMEAQMASIGMRLDDVRAMIEEG